MPASAVADHLAPASSATSYSRGGALNATNRSNQLRYHLEETGAWVPGWKLQVLFFFLLVLFFFSVASVASPTIEYRSCTFGFNYPKVMKTCARAKD
eukprot:COSAG05_NODE_26_length_29797_cov_35.911139_18_plen_97_part_00